MLCLLPAWGKCGSWDEVETDDGTKMLQRATLKRNAFALVIEKNNTQERVHPDRVCLWCLLLGGEPVFSRSKQGQSYLLPCHRLIFKWEKFLAEQTQPSKLFAYQVHKLVSVLGSKETELLSKGPYPLGHLGNLSSFSCSAMDLHIGNISTGQWYGLSELLHIPWTIAFLFSMFGIYRKATKGVPSSN